MPILKRKYKELGINIDEEVDKALRNKEFGLSIMYAGSYFFAAITALLFGLLIFYENLFSEGFWITEYIYWGLVALSYLICYIFVFRNDKYLAYFNQFENSWDKKMRRRNVIFSFIVTIMIFAVFIGSMLI